MSARSPSMVFILVTVLIDMMGIGLIIPVLPSLVGDFTKDVEAQAYWYGALTFTFGLTQFFCAPLLGALSDRYGRRLVLLLSVSGLGTMFLLAGLARSLPELLATRVLGGAVASNISVANAYVADITTPEKRAKSFGIVGAAVGVGFILGPMIGGLVGGLGLRLPFFTAAALGLVNFVYGLFVVPESLPPERRRPIEARRVNPFVALLALARLKGVGSLVTVIGLLGLAQHILLSTWVLSNTFRFGWGPPENGASYFAFGLVAVVVQGGLFGWLLKTLGERRLVLAGLFSGAIAYVGYGVATQGWMMFAVLAANLLGFAVPSALSAIVSKAAPASEQGIAMGSLASLQSVVAVVGPLMGIPLFARVSHLSPSDARVGAPFFLSSVLTIAALVIALVHFSRARSTMDAR